MKVTAKRILARILFVVMLASIVMMPLSASAVNSSSTEYPSFFCHGLLGWGYTDDINSVMNYWGMMSGNMLSYLSSEGYNVHSLSVGSVSSAWDRACEMYAQLEGLEVDYGQAHCNQANAEYLALAQARGESTAELTHSRYGRDYTGEALYSEWSAENKINLVGHSFGGPTCRLFISLLAEGDPDEIAWGQTQVAQYGGSIEDYVSPLFLGGKVEWVNSLTTLASVLNGTTFISACDDETELLAQMCLGLANTIGISPINSIYDFQLEQFGITNVPGQSGEAYLSCVLQSDFLKGTDQAWYDLSIEGCSELNKRIQDYDNIYYFSYAGDATYQSVLTGYAYPNITMFPLFLPFSLRIGRYTNDSEYVLNPNGSTQIGNYTYSTITSSWTANDGMVNTISSRYPLTSAHKAYDSANIEPGIWQVKPDRELDHLQFCGGLTNPKPITIRALYDEIMSDIESTY